MGDPSWIRIRKKNANPDLGDYHRRKIANKSWKLKFNIKKNVFTILKMILKVTKQQKVYAFGVLFLKKKVLFSGRFFTPWFRQEADPDPYYNRLISRTKYKIFCILSNSYSNTVPIWNRIKLKMFELLICTGIWYTYSAGQRLPPCIVSLALGTDLTTLGLNLNSEVLVYF